MALVQSAAQFIAAEQAEFAAMLRRFPLEAWSTRTLCADWTLRDVVIHTAAHIHDQQNDRAVIGQYESRSEEALVAWLESLPAEPTESDYQSQRRFAEIRRRRADGPSAGCAPGARNPTNASARASTGSTGI